MEELHKTSIEQFYKDWRSKIKKYQSPDSPLQITDIQPKLKSNSSTTITFNYTFQ